VGSRCYARTLLGARPCTWLHRLGARTLLSTFWSRHGKLLRGIYCGMR
jgi:hypothetical protein